MRKEFLLDPEEVDFVKAIKKKEGLRSESEALRWILEEYQKQEETEMMIDSVVRKAFQEEKEGERILLERIRWAAQTAEQNSIQMIDAMNTILTTGKLKGDACIFTEVHEHPVLRDSRERIKQRIAHFKQAKDDREKRKGRERVNIDT